MAKAEQIVKEIREKLEDFENNMGSWLNSVGEWGDLFRVKRPSRRDNTFSNPRLTDYHRAAVTLGTTVYRMQTASDPFFEVAPMSAVSGSDQLLKIQATLETQLEASQYRRNLLKACVGTAAFGTQIIEERRAVIGINRFGRRVPVTTFTPRSLLQVAFDRSCLTLDDADWLTTSDLISDAGIMNLAAQAELLDQPWDKRVLEFAAKEEVKAEHLNVHVLKKLRQMGYIGDQDKATRKDIVMYYGKLDVMNDGIEYIAALINRKHLCLFYPNKNQHGKRNFRIGFWNEDPLALDPMGLGLGLFADVHKYMDANRQKAQDNITMASYGMYERLRSAGIDDNDLKIRPLNIVDSDERNGMNLIPVPLNGAEAALKLEEILRSEFKAATGATDTLQAQLTNATASEVALAQNEALRALGVRAELLAIPYMREHLEVLHSDNIEYMKAPINVNRAGIFGAVYPADLQADVDFRIKLVTDQSFKPQRLEKAFQLLQVITSTKSMSPELSAVSVLPIFQEILRMMGMPADQIAQMSQIDPALYLLSQMQGQNGGAGGGMAPGASPPGLEVTPTNSPAMTDVVNTPVGPVMGSAQ